MASRELELILRLRDEATKELQGFNGKLQSMKPQFQKMAMVGTAAFAAIGAGVYKTTQEAAIAEGTWNKFNTVFGEGSDEMMDFVKDLRKEMPSATHEIGRMAADLQDLLVPMGLARNEAQELTKGFLDVANKVAAFNDVDPTQVLEAFKSGLAGSSEPLRRFGINALDGSIELEALNTGLLEAGMGLKDLDPITRSQVKAQALLSLSVKQSADAISGFEENNDSLIRRQQDLQANIKEVSATIGNIFLPIIDDVVKKILPVVDSIKDWVEENPKLTKNIIIVSGAIAGLVAVAGVLGLLLITLTPAIGVLTGAIGLILSPIGLVIVAIGALIAIGILLWKNWDTVAAKAQEYWEKIKTIVSGALNWLKENFLLFMGPAGWVTKIIIDNWEFIAEFFKDIWEKIAMTFKTAIDWIIENTINRLVNSIQRIVDIANRARDAVSGIGGKVSGAVSGAVSRVGGAIGVRDAIITPQGQVIQTDPSDYLIATKTPGALAGGGGIVINIDKVIGSDRRTAESFANEIAKIIKHEVKY